MKPCFALAIAAAVLSATARAADVGVTVEFSQPGVYGRIDIGRYPKPMVVVPQPVIIAPPAFVQAPIYVWVPYEQRKHWSRHCSRYNACGVPVYFVRHDWYNEHVRHPKAKGPPPGKGPRPGKGPAKK